MRIGILSDTHDQVARTVAAVDLLAAEGAEILVHCSDLTGPAMVEACSLLPAYSVFGSNDFDEGAPFAWPWGASAAPAWNGWGVRDRRSAHRGDAR